MKELEVISDEVLVRRAQGGDYPSFEELVKRYEKKIYNLAYRFTRNRDDSNDVLQETFMQAFRGIVNFKGKSKFSTWLHRIAVNICLMKKRKNARARMVSLDKPVSIDDREELNVQLRDDWTKSPLATLENEEVKETISRAVDSMPEQYRNVFVLKGSNGSSNKEVAEILNISVPAMKSRLHRARLFLRDELSKYFQGQENKI